MKGFDKQGEATAFLCDSMLGGLSRWLRAFGYEAFFVHGIDDSELVRLAVKKKFFLLTCDTGVMKRGIVTRGELPALFIPAGLSKKDQFLYATRALKLKPGEPRCMTCSGDLIRVEKEMNKADIPPKTYRWLNDFFRCARCNKLFWKGTHWERMERLFGSSGG